MKEPVRMACNQLEGHGQRAGWEKGRMDHCRTRTRTRTEMEMKMETKIRVKSEK